jgi:hypothetical protein
MAAALTDTSTKSGAMVTSSSRCVEKAERQRFPLAARTRSSTLEWCVGLVKSSALIGRGCQGPRVESEATRYTVSALKSRKMLEWAVTVSYHGRHSFRGRLKQEARKAMASRALSKPEWGPIATVFQKDWWESALRSKLPHSR